MSPLTSILLSSTNAASAIRSLLQFKKNLNSRYSNSFVCKRVGIKYRSYLSDVIHQRKNLSVKYWSPLFDFFELDEIQASYLEVLLRLEIADDQSELQSLHIKKRSLQKELKVPSIAGENLIARSEDLYFSFEVYASFGLFQGSPTYQNLLQHFGAARMDDLNRAMRILLQLGLVEQSQGRYICREAAKFKTPHRDQLEELHQLALDDAKAHTEEWMHDGEQAFFYNCTVSVRRDQYEQKLKEIKKLFRSSYSELETVEADSLIKMLVQIYPHSKLKDTH